MAYQLYYAVIAFIRLRTDFGEYFKLKIKTKQFKSTRIYTLSQFPRQNLMKRLAITLFAIFLTEGNDFSIFAFTDTKKRYKFEQRLITHS